MIGSALRSIGKAQQQNSQVRRYRAPTGGMDLRTSLGELDDPLHCIFSYNLLPFEQGLRVREGFRERVVGIDDGASSGVHTLIPFDSFLETGIGDRLFAVNNEGIWNVSTPDSPPIQMVVFPNQDIDAGYGTFTHYVNQAEDDVLFYADNLNGLYSYDSGLDAWTNTGILTGDITETDVKFVTSHKNNVWFCVRDSTVGYYLPILSNSGQVSPQYFGDKFKHGGSLEGLFSWSVDGGDGVDDLLVAVSHAGDVIMYQGDGPESDTWGMKGVWYIGAIPNTPRFGSEQGGELYLLSSYGIISMNDLLRGVDTNALIAGLEGSTLAHKIAGLIREDMKQKINLRGWDVAMIPAEGGFLISTPTLLNQEPIQYYYNLATQGWGLWRSVPMTCFTQFADSVYFGTADNRIMKMDVPVDNLLLDPPDPTLNGEDIKFSILTSYSALETAGIYKRAKLIRPDFVATTVPAHSSQARYDFDISEAIDFQLREHAPVGIDNWDASNWDTAIWDSSVQVPFPTIGGAWGYGRYIAIATKGETRTTTRLVGWDLIYDIGGPMI